MSLRDAGRRIGIVSAVFFSSVLGEAAEARRDAPVILLGGTGAIDVARAAREATRRLQQPRCRQVLEDFQDKEGRPVGDSLGSLAPEKYLAGLVLREGEIPRGSGRCATPGAAAFTAGGAAVFVCETSFRRLGPGARANALIHEMLHTLGLRENPPTSAEITRRVAERCSH